MRWLATAGVVSLVGGIGAGAGVLIYQSKNRGDSATIDQVTDLANLKRIFPEASSFAHYPFLNYVRPKDLNLNAVADLKAYANDKTKLFNADVDAISKLVLTNALTNANYWSERTKYLANPAAYKQSSIVQRITDQELHLAVAITDSQGKTWYDVGKISL